MKTKNKQKCFWSFFVLIFLISFFFSSKFTFADERYEIDIANPNEYNASFANGGPLYASKPSCPNPPIAVILVGIVTVKVAAKTFYKGLKKITKDPKSASGWALITAATLTITAYGLTAGPTWQCYFSFVRDPIAFDENGNLLGKNNLNELIYVGVRNSDKNREERMKSFLVPFSDHLTICARSPIPYVNFFNSSDDFTCYGQEIDKEIMYEKNPYFDGSKAFICPEEWRIHNYKYEVLQDPTDSNSYAKIATVLDDDEVQLRDFLDMKQNNAPLVCRTGRIGDEFNIHGYVYKIRKIGPKICAQITGMDLGLFTVPSISGTMTIGCHYKNPDDIIPMCGTSTPIKAKDPITNQDIIIDYDNSSCFACFVDKSCYSKTAIHAKSVFPIATSIIECFESSINHIMFGCERTPNNDRYIKGMLTVANENLSFLGIGVILIFIIIFGIKSALSGSVPQSNELIAIAIKIGIILFFIYPDNQKRGVYWVYNQILNMSSGLSSLTLDAMSAKNNICKFDDSLYQSQNQNISYRNDFSFLKPFDILDCNLFFYLGGYLLGYDGSSIAGWEKTVNLIPKVLTMIFPLLFLFNIIGFLMFFFSILILSLFIWIISLTVYSILFLSILILISPLIIPSILFQYTKGFFNSWLRELFAYTMIVPFLYLFLTLMLTSFNGPVFGDTKFKIISGNIDGRSVYHFAYETIDCRANEDLPICSSCLKMTGEDYDVCDGCDIEALSCKMRTQKLGYKNFLFGIFMIAADQRGGYMFDLLGNIGQLLIMSLIFLTLLKSIIIIIARSLGGSRTLYKLLDHGEDPLSNFFKFSSKGLGFGPSFAKILKPKGKNDEGDKDNKGKKKESSNIKGSFE